jgi:hypothetical protein
VVLVALKVVAERAVLDRKVVMDAADLVATMAQKADLDKKALDKRAALAVVASAETTEDLVALRVHTAVADKATTLDVEDSDSRVLDKRAPDAVDSDRKALDKKALDVVDLDKRVDMVALRVHSAVADKATTLDVVDLEATKAVVVDTGTKSTDSNIFCFVIYIFMYL